MKKIAIVLLSVVTALNINAQKVPLSNTILWKISGNGLAASSYIYITGKTCDESLKLDEVAKKVLDTTKAIVVEYDLYGSNDVNKLSKDAIAKTDTEKIKNILTPAQLTSFENKLKEAGYPESAIPQLQIYKVSMVYIMLSGLVGPCGLDRQPLVFETELKPLAKKLGKEYSVLQTIDEFLLENNKLGNKYWTENISYILNNEDNVKLQLKKEADLYKSKNLLELQKLYTAKFYQLLYGTIEQKKYTGFLSDKIETAIKQSSCFISINFSNIAFTDYSVFEILNSKGYKIIPIIK